MSSCIALGKAASALDANNALLVIPAATTAGIIRTSSRRDSAKQDCSAFLVAVDSAVPQLVTVAEEQCERFERVIALCAVRARLRSESATGRENAPPAGTQTRNSTTLAKTDAIQSFGASASASIVTAH